jgi:hypothetical protein
LILGAQANSVAKMLTISVNEGAELINYFPLEQRIFLGLEFRGLYHWQGRRRPAATACQTTTRKLNGVTGARTLSLGSNNWGYQSTRGTKQVYVVWSSGDRCVRLPWSRWQVHEHIGHPPFLGEAPHFARNLKCGQNSNRRKLHYSGIRVSYPRVLGLRGEQRGSDEGELCGQCASLLGCRMRVDFGQCKGAPKMSDMS